MCLILRSQTQWTLHLTAQCVTLYTWWEQRSLKPELTGRARTFETLRTSQTSGLARLDSIVIVHISIGPLKERVDSSGVGERESLLFCQKQSRSFAIFRPCAGFAWKTFGTASVLPGTLLQTHTSSSCFHPGKRGEETSTFGVSFFRSLSSLPRNLLSSNVVCTPGNETST